MKSVLCALGLTAGLLLPAVCRAADPPTTPKTMRICCIGNSFSQGAVSYLRDIARAAGCKAVISEAAYPGCSLKQHWDCIDAGEKDPTSKAARPFGKTTRELIGPGPWDVVTIQQASTISDDLNTYRPYAKQIVDWVKQISPNAEIVVHQTWAYRADDPRFATGKQTHEAMYAKLTAAYRTIADELGLRVLPVGDAVHQADNDPQWGWKPTPGFDPKTAVAPTLPDQQHSLHVGYAWSTNAKTGESRLYYDGHHTNRTGSYLAGCVWFEAIFDTSVVGNTFVPAGMPADYAAFLQKVAHEAVAAERKREAERGDAKTK
jgi:hypothetical protein